MGKRKVKEPVVRNTAVMQYEGEYFSKATKKYDYDALAEVIAGKGVSDETLRDMANILDSVSDWHRWGVWVRKGCREVCSEYSWDTYWISLKEEARRGNFDAYCMYLERQRPPERRFYLPRRKVLKPLVDDLQALFDGELDFLGISLPPRVGKSTLCIFFMTFVIGHRPGVANVMSGHSTPLTDGFYNEILNIMTDVQEYAWKEIFPVNVVSRSAKYLTLDVERKKRFPSITCRSIGGTLTGAVEVGNGGVLYCDDLVEDLEESLNPQRLENKYNAYLNQLKDRKKDGSGELMVGTRWNVLDPLGRVQDQYADNPRYRFRVIPALDENDESNFVYDYGLGFSTEYYHDMRNSIDDATWWAKYMGQPYVREGLVFPHDELQWYNGELPAGQPDMIRAVVDVAFGGGDSLSMPIAYVYGDEVFIHDVVFNNQDKSVTMPIVEGRIKSHGIQTVCFEANAGGDAYSEQVSSDLKAEGFHVNIRSRRTTGAKTKLGRIIQYAPDIRRMYFRSDGGEEYRRFMNEVCMFTQSGKNKHDDAPDSLALLEEDISTQQTREVGVFRRW